jgi:hypothetical protein
LTLEQFLEALENTPMDWKLKDGKYIRCDGQCPISSFQHKPCGDWYKVADELCIHHELALEIINAADDRRMSHGGYRPEVRAKLLKACGLS